MNLTAVEVGQGSKIVSSQEETTMTKEGVHGDVVETRPSSEKQQGIAQEQA